MAAVRRPVTRRRPRSIRGVFLYFSFLILGPMSALSRPLPVQIGIAVACLRVCFRVICGGLGHPGRVFWLSESGPRSFALSFILGFIFDVPLGRSLGRLGAILGHLGAVLGLSWGSWANLGAQENPKTILSPFWGNFGAHFGAQNWLKNHFFGGRFFDHFFDHFLTILGAILGTILGPDRPKKGPR